MDERIDLIMDIMEAAFDQRWGEAWNRHQVCDALSTPNTHCLLTGAVAGPLPAGQAAAGFLLSRAAPGEEEILLLAVRPDQRRRGVASRLIAGFKEAAAKRGAERLFLEMRENNQADTFYRAHQFVPVGRRRAYYRQIDGTYLDAITFAHNIGSVDGAFI